MFSGNTRPPSAKSQGRNGKPSDQAPGTDASTQSPPRPQSSAPPRPSGRGRYALQVVSTTPPPQGFSRTSTVPRSQDRTSGVPRPQVFLGQAKAGATQQRNSEAVHKLFGGETPLVTTKTQGAQRRYRWPTQVPPESLAPDITAVCRFWLSRDATCNDALALLDAVYRKTTSPGTWHGLLSECAQALVQASLNMPAPQALDWLHRLHAFAQWAREQHDHAAAARALDWATAMVHNLGHADHGPVARAIELLKQWKAPGRVQPSPDDASPLRPRHSAVPWRPPLGGRVGALPVFKLDTQEASRESFQGSSQESLQESSQEFPPEPPPVEDPPAQTPRPRPAVPRLPPLDSDIRHEPSPVLHPVGPLCMSLLRAYARNDFGPFIAAMRARRDLRRGAGVPQALIDDLNHSLRELLDILTGDPLLTPEQRAELLFCAYPLVSSHPDDPRIASEYATVVRGQLPPEQAEHLLLALGEPVASLAPNHLYRRRLQDVQRLIDWGLPAPVARRLGFDATQIWAYELLFQAPFPRSGRPAQPARLGTSGQGSTLAFSVNAGPDWSKAEIDAVLTLAQAWEDDAPELAMKLLLATRDKARLDDKRTSTKLLHRWKQRVYRLQQYCEFAPWLHVQRSFDPLQGRFGQLDCKLDTAGARKASSTEREEASQAVWSWVQEQMHSTHGLAWPALQALLVRIGEAFGKGNMFHFEQWLSMAVWELQRSGDVEPLRQLLPHLGEQTLRPDTLLMLLKALHREWPQDLVCATALQTLLWHLGEDRDVQVAAAQLHASYLQAVLARTDTDLRHELVQRYLEKHPFKADESSGDLLQQLSHMRSDLPPADAQVWEFLMELTAPTAPAAWLLWRRLVRQLAPWIARQLLTAPATDSPSMPDQRPRPNAARRTLEAVWILSLSPQGPAAQSLEQQFELLAALADALPSGQALPMLRQLESSCAEWSAQMTQASRPGPGAAARPLPPWLIAMRAALQALIRGHGGSLPLDDEARTAPLALTALDFFRDWFSARLVANRGYLSSAQQYAQRIRQQYTADLGGPAGRLISDMLQGPLPGEGPT